MVFDGEELLEFAIKNIRTQVDYVSVTYQTKSYFGNTADPLPLLNHLKAMGLIDELIFFEPDLTVHHKVNELNLRNIGLTASRNAGCTHHISADVDEFYKNEELAHAKSIVVDYDFTMAWSKTYYKDPTFLVTPDLNCPISFIHSINNQYVNNSEFPFKIETTRRLLKCNSFYFFSKDEFVIHHMSYVRKDILKKLNNSDNGRFYKTKKFIDDFNKHNVGDRVCLLPDFKNKRTTKVENEFGIYF